MEKQEDEIRQKIIDAVNNNNNIVSLNDILIFVMHEKKKQTG